MRIVTHIYARHPCLVGRTVRILPIAVRTVERSDFRVHTVILGQREKVLRLYIEPQFGDTFPRDKTFEVVAQRNVLQADVIAVLQVEVRKLSVAHIVVGHAGNIVAGSFARPAVENPAAVVGLRGIRVAIRLGDLEACGTGSIQAEVEAFIA